MDNIVSLGTDRPRPPRIFGVPPSGARILLFTGVRYCREDEAEPSHAGTDRLAGALGRPSNRPLDAATH